jgi:hypothetical protein
VAGSNGGSHSGCVSWSDDEGDTSFTAVGGVVHDDAPTPVPSPAPTLNPSPECPGGESLYKLLLTDGASDGWEGATYRVVDADGTVAASGTLSDGGSDLLYVCLPDGSYELEFTAPAGWGDDGDDGSVDDSVAGNSTTDDKKVDDHANDDAAGGDDSCAQIVGPNGGSHSGCVLGSDDEGDTSFTAVGGVVHDDAPTPAPSTVPSPGPTAAYCTDGRVNKGETDVDCGGADCPACAVGGRCVVNDDCESRACVGSVCVDAPTGVPTPLPSPSPTAAHCEDGRRNGLETGVDCGGSECPACDLGEGCEVSADCASGLCGRDADASCVDVWTTLVGVNSRSMTLNTSVYAELFTDDELSALRASWAVDETWTMTALGSSTCDEEHRFGFSGGDGFLVLIIPAGASSDAVSATDCVNRQNADFSVRSAAAWEEKLDCELTLSNLTLCKAADSCTVRDDDDSSGIDDQAARSSSPSPPPTLNPTDAPTSSPQICLAAPSSLPTSGPTQSPTSIPSPMPVPAPSSVPTPNPSPECPSDESLYKIQLSDNHADGWEGASYEIHDTNGAVAASGTLSDGGAGMKYV